jgi:uncharacterized damage-inducible protein DinB
MTRAATVPTAEFNQALLEIYVVNERMNQMVLERLDPRAWRTKGPGVKIRTIAAIFAHMHHVRRKWLRLSAPHIKLPGELDDRRCTKRQVQAALAASGKLCTRMLAEALDPEGRVTHFQRDGWSKRWPSGAAMFSYLIMHDVHHRGQICMLANLLGYPIKNGHEIWMWERLWKQCGFAGPR